MTRRSLLGVVAVVVVTAAVGTGAAAGGSSDDDGRSKLAGTWNVTVLRPAPLPPLSSLQIFTSDGSVIEMANESPATRTAQYGSWERVENRLYASSGTMFRFNPQTGAHVATMKINRNIRLSKDGRTFDQAAIATTYDLNGNVLASFPVVAHGERMQIERIPDQP